MRGGLGAGPRDERRVRALRRRSRVLLLLAASRSPARWIAPRVLLAGWLAAWWCALGLVLGACVNAVDARAHRRALGRGAAAARWPRWRAPCRWLLLALFLPLAAALRVALSRGPTPASAWLHGLDAARLPARLARRRLSSCARLALYALAWWLARAAARSLPAQRRAPRAALIAARAARLAGGGRPADVAGARLVQHRLRPGWCWSAQALGGRGAGRAAGARRAGERTRRAGAPRRRRWRATSATCC